MRKRFRLDFKARKKKNKVRRTRETQFTSVCRRRNQNQARERKGRGEESTNVHYSLDFNKTSATSQRKEARRRRVHFECTRWGELFDDQDDVCTVYRRRRRRLHNAALSLRLRRRKIAKNSTGKVQGERETRELCIPCNAWINFSIN